MSRAIGAVCTVEFALFGHEVHYTALSEQKDQLPAVRFSGGVTVEDDAQHRISKKTGFAKLHSICATTMQGLKTVEAESKVPGLNRILRELGVPGRAMQVQRALIAD